ncbi:MAG TPA: DMT family transporter [Usitatibacter sp.]|nr:DMT family transporter [Usitatibacter sp.]
MRPQDFLRLVVLAALWGGSYLFMRFAVPYFGPVALIEVRVAIAGAALVLFVRATRESVGWKAYWRGYLFVGSIGLAAPFVLIAQGLTAIDASTAAILNALSPLFATIVAAVWTGERVTAAKAAGIALCLVGTAVLVGWTPAPMTPRQLLAAGCCVLATALYGYTIVFTKVKLKGAKPMATAAATMVVATLTLLPFTPLDRHYAAIPMAAWMSALGLALLSTAFAFILYYRLIADVGPVKTITVTLLVPVFGMLWGVLLLGEPLTAGRLAGCAIILAGCSLILGLLTPSALNAGLRRVS